MISEGPLPGALEFSFVSSRDGEPEVRYTWDVPSELIDELNGEGQFSEDLLRQQLTRAMAKNAR